MMNNWNGVGRLTKDPAIKEFDSGKIVVNFTLAVQRTFRNENNEYLTDFIPIIAWGRTAEICKKYLSKGSQVAVVGNLQTRSYTAKDGNKRYVTEILANEVFLLGSKKENEVATSDDLNNEQFNSIDEDDMPF